MTSKTKIQEEKELSLRYELSRYSKTKDLVELTVENVARVEFMIRHNSRYAGQKNSICICNRSK